MIATLQSAGAGVSDCDGHDVGVSVPDAGVSGCDASRSGVPDDDDDDDEASMNNFCPEVVRAIEGVKFIAEHLKREDEARYVSNDTIRYDTTRYPCGRLSRLMSAFERTLK